VAPDREVLTVRESDGTMELLALLRWESFWWFLSLRSEEGGEVGCYPFFPPFGSLARPKPNHRSKLPRQSADGRFKPTGPRKLNNCRCGK
jgi:hypothetical protein